MNTLLSILFPRVSRSLVRLRSVVGLNQNIPMPRLTTEEEVEVINTAISAIEFQKTVISELRAQLGGLPEENAELKRALAAADESDATSDEALSALKSAAEAAEDGEEE